MTKVHNLLMNLGSFHLELKTIADLRGRTNAGMSVVMIDISLIEKEVEFTAVRSGGPGGQNVNKVSSAAVMTWDYMASQALSDGQKSRIQKNLKNSINKEGLVFIRSEEFRDLERNKARCLEKLETRLKRALHTQKPRKPTRPSKSSVLKAKEKKTQRSRIKKMRKKPDY